MGEGNVYLAGECRPPGTKGRPRDFKTGAEEEARLEREAAAEGAEGTDPADREAATLPLLARENGLEDEEDEETFEGAKAFDTFC